MKKVFLFFSLIVLPSFAQIQNELHSPENVKRFADYLFNEGDYLRSIFEYEKLTALENNDTIEFKIALAYQQMGKYELALERFSDIKTKITIL